MSMNRKHKSSAPSFYDGTDFKRAVTEKHFIDKTLFIKDVVDDGRAARLILRPRHFSKSLNMSMLKYFFEKTEEDNSELFKPLKIWKAKGNYYSEQGKYPVIHFSLNYEASSYDKAKKYIIKELSSQYKLYKKGIFNAHLKEDLDEQKVYQSIIERTAEDEIIDDSLRKLTEHLSKLYKKQVIILIDEYDKLIFSCSQNGYIDQITQLIRNLLRPALKGNQWLKWAFLTGVSQIKNTMFAGPLNIVHPHNILSENYASHFGFSQEEVEELFLKGGVRKEELKSLMQSIKQLYNGYLIGSQVIFNPYSIICYFYDHKSIDKGIFYSYWTEILSLENQGLVERLHVLDSTIKQEISTLLLRKPIQKSIIDIEASMNDHRNDASIWSFLLLNGYLSYKPRDDRQYDLVIPNEEMFVFFKELMDQWSENNKSIQHSSAAKYDSTDQMRDIKLSVDNKQDSDGIQHLTIVLPSDTNGQVANTTKELFMQTTLIPLLRTKDFKPAASDSSQAILSPKTILQQTNSDGTSALPVAVVASPTAPTNFIESPRQIFQCGWNCFDLAVGLDTVLNIDAKDAKTRAHATRDKLVAFALDEKNISEFRRLLAPEIRHAAGLTAVYLNLQKDKENSDKERNTRLAELFGVAEALAKARISEASTQAEVSQQIVKLLTEDDRSKQDVDVIGLDRHTLPASLQTEALRKLMNDYQGADEAMQKALRALCAHYPEMQAAVDACKQALSKTQGNRVINIVAAEDLYVFLKVPEQQKRYPLAWEMYSKQYNEKFVPHEKALQTYCEDEKTYSTYVKDYYGKQQGWVAFQRSFRGEGANTSMVDIAARLLNAQIVVCQKDPKTTNVWEEIYCTADAVTQNGKKMYVQFNGRDHFVALQPILSSNAPSPQNQSDEKSAPPIASAAISSDKKDEAKQTSHLASGFIIDSLTMLKKAIQTKPSKITIYADSLEKEDINEFFRNLFPITQCIIHAENFSLSTHRAGIIKLIKNGLIELIFHVTNLQDCMNFIENIKFYSSLKKLEFKFTHNKENFQWQSDPFIITPEKIKREADKIIELNKKLKAFLEVELPQHEKKMVELDISADDKQIPVRKEQVEYLMGLGENFNLYTEYRSFHKEKLNYPVFEIIDKLAGSWNIPRIVGVDAIDKLKVITSFFPHTDLNQRVHLIRGISYRLIDHAVTRRSDLVTQWLLKQGADITREYTKKGIPTFFVNIDRDSPNFPFDQVWPDESNPLSAILLKHEPALYDALAWYLCENRIHDVRRILATTKVDIHKLIPTGTFKNFTLFQLVIYYKRTSLCLDLLKNVTDEEKTNIANSLYPLFLNPSNEEFPYSAWSVISVVIYQGQYNELVTLGPSKHALLQKFHLKDIDSHKDDKQSKIDNSYPISYKQQIAFVRLLLSGAISPAADLASFKRCLKHCIDQKIIDLSLIKDVVIYHEELAINLPLLHFVIENNIYSIIEEYIDFFAGKLTEKVHIEAYEEALNPLQLAVFSSTYEVDIIKSLYKTYQKYNYLDVVREPLPNHEKMNLFQFVVINEYESILPLFIDDKNCPINAPFPANHKEYPGWLPIHIAILNNFYMQGSVVNLLVKRMDLNLLEPFPQGGNFLHELEGLYPLSAIFYSDEPRRNYNLSRAGGRIISGYYEEFLPLIMKSAISNEKKLEIYTQALWMAVKHQGPQYNNLDHTKQIQSLVKLGADFNYAVGNSDRIVDYARKKGLSALFPTASVHSSKQDEKNSLTRVNSFIIPNGHLLSPIVSADVVSSAKLIINFSGTSKKSAGITHEGIRKIISETIINFEKTAKSFNEDANDELTTPETLTGYLDKIKNLLSAARTEILQKGGDHTSVWRANDVLHYLEKQYTEVTNQLKPPTVISQTSTPSDSKSSYWQENRLRLEQQLLLNPSTTLAQRFSSTLELIRKQGHSDQLPPNGVFICYAWPDQKDEAQKHLSWVQPFLLGLRQHLQAAGIANAKLDIRDNPPGGNIYDYMRFAETADFVLLIGTESLLKKHQIGTSAVCTELININRKREQDVKANKYRVFPIMISGDYRESFPAHYELYTAVQDWKGTKTYFQHFQWLVAALYSTTEAAFAATWEKFLDKSQKYEKLILTTGLDEQSVLDKLKAETKETEQKKIQQALASRQMLNLAPAMNDSKHTPAAIASAAIATSVPIGTTSNFFQAADTKKELVLQTQAPASTTATHSAPAASSAAVLITAAYIDNQNTSDNFFSFNVAMAKSNMQQLDSKRAISIIAEHAALKKHNDELEKRKAELEKNIALLQTSIDQNKHVITNIEKVSQLKK